MDDNPFADLIPNAPQGQRIGYLPGIAKPEPVPSGYRRTADGGLAPIPGGPADKMEGPKDPPSGYRWGANGGLEFIPGGPADKSKTGGTGAGTETEAKSAMFLRRMLGANQDYDQLGVGPRGAVNQTLHNWAPGALKIAPEAIGGDDKNRKAADRDINDFIGASLRYESGASINSDEFNKQDQIFYPHAGDEDPDLQERYKQARIRAIEGMAASTGRAMTPDLQAALDQWRASVKAVPQGGNEHMDGTNRPVFEPGEGQPTLSQNGTHDGIDPRFVGANARVQSMLHDPKADDKQILGYLNGLGFGTGDMVAIAQQLQAVRKFQRGNPNYHGKYDIDLGRMTLPDDALNTVAKSPVGAGVIAAADTLSGGHLDNAVGAAGGNADLANLGIETGRQQHGTASLIGDMAGGALLYGATGGAGSAGAARVGALAPKALLGDAALGAYVSSGQGGTQLADPGQMVLGAATGAGAGSLGRKVVNGAASAISPTGGELAPLLKAGVNPTIGQRMGGVFNRAEQAFTSIPGVGGIQRSARNAAMDEMQRGAFNQSLHEIDTALPKGVMKGTQAHAFAQQQFDTIYDKARSGMRFGLDNQFTNDVANISNAADLLNGDAKGIVRKIADDVGNKLRAAGGSVDGDQFKLIQRRIANKIAALRSSKTGDDELAGVLGDLQTAIDNAARRQSPKEASALLDKADKGYAKLVIIENAAKARGGEPGEFSGVGLDRAVQTTNSSRRSRAYLRGEANMQDYSTAARRLGDNVADSGTAERILTNGGIAAAAHSVSPLAAIPWAIDTAATLPGVRQTLGAIMRPSANAGRAASADALRLRAGTYGGVLGGLIAGPVQARPKR